MGLFLTSLVVELDINNFEGERFATYFKLLVDVVETFLVLLEQYLGLALCLLPTDVSEQVQQELVHYDPQLQRIVYYLYYAPFQVPVYLADASLGTADEPLCGPGRVVKIWREQQLSRLRLGRLRLHIL